MLLTLLALAATTPAFGLNSDGAEPVGAQAPVALSVSTSLDSCGMAGTDVVCKLDVSFGSVNGASSYTATVTRADGSVVDYGAIGAGGASLWVPYVGPGSYSVRVTAYGTPPHKGGRGNVVASGSDHPIKADVSDARGNNARTHRKPGTRLNGAAAAHATATNHPGNTHGSATSAPPADASEPPPPETTTSTTTTTSTCTEDPSTQPPLNPLPPDNDPDNDDEDNDGISDAEELAAAAAGQQMTLDGEPPVSVDCP